MKGLIEYCCKMHMSYSYKPVLIMAIAEYDGKICISDAVDYFVEYYARRLSSGLVAEKTNSIFSNLNCSLEQIAYNIKTNPVKALLNSDYFEYDKDLELLSVKRAVWEDLIFAEKKKIIDICRKRLDEYYIKIENVPLYDTVYFQEPDAKNGYLCNNYLSEFSIRGETFSSVDQYMVYQKALQFYDYSARDRIRETSDTEQLKQIDQKIRNYDERIWSGKRQLIAYHGLISKFSQNEILKENLLNTGAAMLVGCSEYDKVWCIGVSIKDKRRYLTRTWEGENLLGFSLMQVRNVLCETRCL